MVAKSISKETQPGRLSLCVKRVSPDLMSSEERCHFEGTMLGHLRSPPHRLPEKYMKAGFSGERFTIYTWSKRKHLPPWNRSEKTPKSCRCARRCQGGIVLSLLGKQSRSSRLQNTPFRKPSWILAQNSEGVREPGFVTFCHYSGRLALRYGKEMGEEVAFSPWTQAFTQSTSPKTLTTTFSSTYIPRNTKFG